MIQGGFQHIDVEKLLDEASGHFPLPCDTEHVYNRQVLTNNGRTATVYLLQNCFDFGEDDVLLLPDYLCLSVIVAVEEPKVRYRFYHINRDLSIDMPSLYAQLDEHVKGIYLIHYFGVPYELETIQELQTISRERGIPLVEDITQTLLTCVPGRMGFADYIVSSTRKWFPTTDGGILAVRDGAPMREVPLGDPYNEAAYKQLLISFLRDYYDAHPERDLMEYAALEQKANKARYVDLSPRGMTEYSRNIMFHCDLDAIARIRVENYLRLYDRLSAIPQVRILSKPITAGDGCIPFGLVILVEDRDAFHQAMIRKGILGEIQWILPLDYYDPGQDARYLADHNVMLQCDQRYTPADMDEIADTITAYFY